MTDAADRLEALGRRMGASLIGAQSARPLGERCQFAIGIMRAVADYFATCPSCCERASAAFLAAATELAEHAQGDAAGGQGARS